MGTPSVFNMFYYSHRAPRRCGPYRVPSKTFVLAIISEVSYIFIPHIFPYTIINWYIFICSIFNSPCTVQNYKEGNGHTRELSVAICINCLFITPPETPFSFWI